MHPNGKFLYTVEEGTPDKELIVPYAIVRRLTDEKDGTLGQPVTETTYHLDGDVHANDCNLLILEFNTSGTAMYDVVSCTGADGTSDETYYERSVDSQTGALGPDQQIYTWNYVNGDGQENIQFVNNLMFDFGNADFPPRDWVNIYQVKPNVTTPLVNCTSSMWAVCGGFYRCAPASVGQVCFSVSI